MEHFTYLGSVISNDATVSNDLDNRLFKASSSSGRLSNRVWQSHSPHLSTKLQVYRAVVVTTLLYDAETWVLYWKQIRLLKRFHHHCLRSILGIKWQDHVSNEEVLKRVHPASVAVVLGWSRHKDGRRTHAQSCLLQRAPRRKVRSWRTKKALQRSAEETACTSRNQPSVMAAEGLRLRQLELIREESWL